MSELPETKEYQQVCHSVHTYTQEAIASRAAVSELLARIAELEAKVEHDEDNLEGLQHALIRANQQYTQAEAALADWRAMYSIHVRPKCGSDMAYNAQVAFDMGCVETDRAIAADRARAEEGSGDE